MQSRDFCYWLQGFFEIQSMTAGIPPEANGLNAAQVSMIRHHLHMVFAHEIDPAMGNADHQAKLNTLHGNQNTDPSLVKYRC